MAYPNSRVRGFDYHDGSILAARKAAQAAGVAERVQFEVAKAKDFPGEDYDLVAMFDCLHDMGDPAGAAKHVLRSMKPTGHWLIVEPFANDSLTDNLNPVGRIYLRGLHAAVHAVLALTGGGPVPGGPGRRGAAEQGGHVGWVRKFPARRRDAVQSGVRSPAVTSASATATPDARPPRLPTTHRQVAAPSLAEAVEGGESAHRSPGRLGRGNLRCGILHCESFPFRFDVNRRGGLVGGHWHISLRAPPWRPKLFQSLDAVESLVLHVDHHVR